jgi:hypothetical protein
MVTIVRLLLGVGLFSLGYYVGREIGRLESLREEMRRLRAAVDRAGIPVDRTATQQEAGS